MHRPHTAVVQPAAVRTPRDDAVVAARCSSPRAAVRPRPPPPPSPRSGRRRRRRRRPLAQVVVLDEFGRRLVRQQGGDGAEVFAVEHPPQCEELLLLGAPLREEIGRHRRLPTLRRRHQRRAPRRPPPDRPAGAELVELGLELPRRLHLALWSRRLLLLHRLDLALGAAAVVVHLVVECTGRGGSPRGCSPACRTSASSAAAATSPPPSRPCRCTARRRRRPSGRGRCRSRRRPRRSER